MKDKTKKKLIDYAIILIFAIVISIPMLSQDFNIYVDDGIQHIARLMGTMQSIEEGQIIPVIMSNFCNGFGYSWNLFYSPITAYIPLIFRIFTSSFELMLKLFIVLVGFLSGIAMYEFVNKISKNRYAGLLSAIIYICAPYRLTDMYMRMAVSELTSFIFLPIVFHGMYNIFNYDEQNKANNIKKQENNVQDNELNKDNDNDETKRSKRIYLKKSLLLTLGASGLILTHSVIAMYTAIICFIYLLTNIKELKNKQVLQALAINILLIVLITSFYTVPLLEHKLTTDYEVFKPGRMERTEALIYYKVDFLDLIYTGNNTMNYEIGLVSIIGIVLTILAHKKIDKNTKKIYWFSLVAGIVCVIMSLRIFPFEKLPAILKLLQFTFRLLEFSSFFFAVVAGINYSLAIKDFKLRDVLVLGIISYLFIVPSFFKLNYEKQWSEDKLWPAVEVNENTGRVHAGCATFEYLPSKAFENLDYIKTRENRVYVLAEDGTYKLPEENSGITIENEEKNGTELSFNIKKMDDEETTNLNDLDNLNNSSDLVEIEEIENKDKKKELEGSDTVNGITLELPYIYYLGYTVEIETNGVIQKLETFESKNGFVATSLPESALDTAEEVHVTVEYTGTTLMKITFIISILSVLGTGPFATYLSSSGTGLNETKLSSLGTGSKEKNT